MAYQKMVRYALMNNITVTGLHKFTFSGENNNERRPGQFGLASPWILILSASSMTCNVPSLWNTLPDEMKGIRSVRLFAHKLKEIFLNNLRDR